MLDYLLPAARVFGAGVLVGAGFALLLAPKPGADLRHQIAAFARRHRKSEADPVSVQTDAVEHERAA